MTPLDKVAYLVTPPEEEPETEEEARLLPLSPENEGATGQE